MRTLLTGASGHLGAFLLEEARRLSLDVVAWTGRTHGTHAGYPLVPVDLGDAAKTEAAFAATRPEAVLHAAALSAIADCHRRPELAHRLNVQATQRLVDLAAATGARLLYISTDLVFDGARGNYREADEPRPLSIYAKTKREGEKAVLQQPRNLAVRVGWLVGPKRLGAPRFFDDVVSKVNAGRRVSLFTDEWRSPLGLPNAAAALWDLLRCDAKGILHLGGPDRLSRYDMGLKLARHLGANAKVIEPARQADLAAPEPRPSDVSLDSTKWRTMRPGLPWTTFEETLQEVL